MSPSDTNACLASFNLAVVDLSKSVAICPRSRTIFRSSPSSSSKDFADFWSNEPTRFIEFNLVGDGVDVGDSVSSYKVFNVANEWLRLGLLGNDGELLTGSDSLSLFGSRMRILRNSL